MYKRQALGEYFFIIDLLNEAPDLLQFAYQELDSLGIQTKVLGQYQVYTCLLYTSRCV